VKLEVVTIGTELLLGQTLDTNAAELGRALAAAGVEVVRHSSVADRADAIRAAVFTPQGQIGAKSAPAGRYSRGLGLLSAALAAAAAKATVRVVPAPRGSGNAFELAFPRSQG